MEIGTFNVTTDAEDERMKLRTDNDTGPWKERVKHVRNLIRCFNPLILGVQEASKDQVNDLADGLINKYEWFGTCRSGIGIDEFLPIFYHKKRVKVHNQGHFWLSETPDVPGSVSWNCVAPRMATWGRFEYTGSDSINFPKNMPFYVFNTQLDSSSEVARAFETVVLLKRIEEIVATDGQPALVFLVGDFNCTRGSLPWEVITGRSEFGGVRGWFVDSWEKALTTRNEALRTYHDYQPDLFDPAGSEHSDFVLYGMYPGAANGCSVEEALAKVKVKCSALVHIFGSHHEAYLTRPSDHYPVSSEFEFW